MGRKDATNGHSPGLALPAAITHTELRALLSTYEFWTERGYDAVRGEYVYTLTIVLASGEAAIRDE